MALATHQQQSSCVTEEERKLKSFARRNLQKLPNWPVWDAAFDSQLDGHHRDGTIGTPVKKRDAETSGDLFNILRFQWSSAVKADCARKSHACMDGSKRAAPWLRQFVNAHASCIEQPCQRLFFAIAAVEGMVIVCGDAKNAFQNSPSPTVQCHMRIDDAHLSWFRKCFPDHPVDSKTMVVPLFHASQGHPKAGTLWEGVIVGIPGDLAVVASPPVLGR
jgi:hypothetical protein